MGIKIALIALLSASAISALSLEGFKCRDHTIMTGDPVQPVRTVHICGVEDYATPPSFLDYQKKAAIEQNARNNYVARSYGVPSFWSNRGASTPIYSRWPLQRPTESNESAQLLSRLFRDSAVQPATYEAATNYATNSRDHMEVERLLQEKLRSITEDTSEVKNSMNDVVANVKNILDTLLMQSANQQKDINVNVNLKLDSVLEDLIRDFLAIIKNEVNSVASAEPTSTEHIVAGSDNDSEDYASMDSTSYAQENSSEEQVTVAHVDSAEHSDEQDAKEEYDGNSSVEDFDSWLRLHFGPIVKTPTYDEDTDNSEQENSAEKSEESFESWFNAVYRKHRTQATTDRNSLDEQTHNSQESEEHTTNISVENLQESDDQYTNVDAIKSAEENTISEETTESSEEVDNIYDAIFVPTTMNSVQQSEEAELLQNGDKYDYTTGMDPKIHQKYKCTDFGYQPILNDLEYQESDILQCLTANQKVVLLDLSIFKLNKPVVKEIEESKESAETETAITESNESKSSEETETPINESNESKSSEETETPTTETNESKSSEETETPINESNESKSSEESETPTTETNESRDSSEVESDINFSVEPRAIDWYQYDDEYPYIQ